MERIPEAELMDDPAQAKAYAEADFSEPNQAFVEYFATRLPASRPRAVLDLGCGPAELTLRFARAHAGARITAIDGSAPMIALARAAVEAAGLNDRIEFRCMRLPAPGLARAYDAIISNSLLHHLADPMVLWEAIRGAARTGAAVMVMDLIRPATRAQAQAIVARYSGAEPEILKRDFFNSLCAAYRPEEIQDQLRRAGLAFAVETVSDRHWIAHGRVSA